MLCQKWQQQEKDIGLIIGLADPSIYYYNTEYKLHSEDKL